MTSEMAAEMLPPWERQPTQLVPPSATSAADEPAEPAEPSVPAAAATSQRPCCDYKDPHTGQQCQRLPIRGGLQCVNHGGQLPTIRAAAQLRLLYIAEPAMETLHKALGTDCEMTAANGVAYCKVHGSDCPDWATRVNAAKAILDRTGFGPKSTVTLEKAPNEFAAMSTEDLAAELQDLADEVRTRMSQRLQPINQRRQLPVDTDADASERSSAA